MNDLASAEAAPLQAHPTVIDIGTGARGETALHGLLRDRRVGLDVSIEPGIFVSIDPGHLTRALRNVIGNAIRHSPSGGRVTVTAVPADAAAVSPAASAASGSVVAVRVTDQGPGIAAADVPHVFERFLSGRSVGG